MKPNLERVMRNGFADMTKEELIDELIEMDDLLQDSSDLNDHLMLELERYEENDKEELPE